MAGPAPGGKVSAYGLPITTPQLSISPAFPEPYVFGLDGFFRTRTFTVTNTGPAPTSVIAARLSGADATQFRVESDSCTGTSLAAGATCTVTASFAPTLSGTPTALLSAKADAGGTASALLSGTAQPLTISPPSTQLAAIFSGSASTTNFTVTNLTADPVGPIAFSLTQDSGGWFTIATDGCAGQLLAAGKSCTIAVRFAPTTNESRAATLIAKAPGYEAQAYMYGSGLPRLAIAPDTKDFGTVRVGDTASATFTVTNISPSAAGPISDTIEDYFGSSPAFSITSDACAGHTLMANATCTLEVTFAAY